MRSIRDLRRACDTLLFALADARRQVEELERLVRLLVECEPDRRS